MATDVVNNAEDAEMAECDGDKVVTMMDVLQEQQEFEEDANAVLGASDDKNCTYPKGYIKRQALYACLTCCTEAQVDPTKRAGVCLACSLNCHENHELIELYTKRNFRCDCGNPKFNSHPCQFTPGKTDLNEDNIYNQNFSGLYCVCHRPYPDPESTIEDDMIQCIICEDWLHASHLEAVVPANDQYSEMICKGCMEKNEFLHDYSLFAVTVEAGDVDIVTVNGDAKSADNSLCNGDSEEKLVNGIEEKKTEIETAIATVNGDVEMEEGKSEDKVIDGTDNKTIAETTKDDLSDVKSTELKPEENDKPDCDDSKMDSDTESKITEQGEQSVGTTDAPARLEDSNTEKEHKETTEDISDKQPDDKSDAQVNTPEFDADQNNETSPEKTESTDEKPENVDDKTDEKMESIDNEPEKADETQEQISKPSRSEEDVDGDNVQENKPDTSDKTEQQLLDDLSALTADNPALEKTTDTATDEKADAATEEKSVESMDQTEHGEEKENVETNNEESPKVTPNESEEKPVVENKTATGNIEAPDTSQSEKVAKENDEEKTDSVMDAIDELLQTANEAREKETMKETKEPASESAENKESTDNVETKESKEDEMSTTENKLDNKVPEKTEAAEPNDKTNTEDVEMSDTTIRNELTSESKVSDEPTTDSDTKDDNDAKASDNTSTTEAKANEDKLENELLADVEKPEVADESISQENIALNETDDKLKTLSATDNELKTNDENDSTNKNGPSKDDNEVPVTENPKEHKRKFSTDLTDDTASKKAKLECVRPKGVKRFLKGATFWPSNFRQKLCTCGECISMYKDLKVLFLTDLEDTVFAYESLGKENVAGGASQYEKGMQALSSLDRIQQINALTEYNRMRDKLLDFLQSFKDKREVVKEEDIKAFFAGMKPRREPDGVYFCR